MPQLRVYMLQLKIAHATTKTQCSQILCLSFSFSLSLSAQRILLPMQEIHVQSLGQKDPLEREMATHTQYCCLENPIDRGSWQATIHGSQRVTHNGGCTQYDMHQYLCQHCAKWVTFGVRLKRWCELTMLFLLRRGRGAIQTQSGCVWSPSSQPQSYRASVT